MAFPAQLSSGKKLSRILYELGGRSGIPPFIESQRRMLLGCEYFEKRESPFPKAFPCIGP
jgi:hypothetical protein